MAKVIKKDQKIALYLIILQEGAVIYKRALIAVPKIKSLS